MNESINHTDNGKESPEAKKTSIWDMLPPPDDQDKGQHEEGHNRHPLYTRLKRLGFYEAVKEIECPENKLAILLEEYRMCRNAKIERYDELCNHIKQHIEDRIELAKERIAEIKQKLSENICEAELYTDRSEVITNELNEINQRLYDTKMELAYAKQSMLDSMADEVEEELKKTMRLHAIAYDELFAFNKKKFDNEKPAYDKRLVQLENFKTKLEERYEVVQERLKVLAGEGVNPYACYVLIAFGTAAIAAAGIFFSTFTYTANFGNQDIVYFMLNGFVNSGNSDRISFWTKAAALLAVIILLTLISWGCYKIYEKVSAGPARKNKATLRQNWRWEYGTDKVSGKLRSNNWYAFWLGIVPLLTLAGICILIFSFGKNQPDIQQLSSSTEGLVTGSALAIGIAGVIYLYIIKIIEPRLMNARKEAEPGRANWVKRNWELVLCIILFFTCIISIIFLNIHNTGSNNGDKKLSPQNTVAIAMLCFIAAVLPAALSFGYGVRCRGLISTGAFLRRDIEQIQTYIDECCRPQIPVINTDQEENLYQLINNILQRLKEKALYDQSDEAKRVYVYNLQPGDKPEDSVWRRLFRKRHKVNQQTTATALTSLSEWEARYFPVYHQQIIQVTDEYNRKQEELKRINDFTDKIEDEKNQIKDQLKKELEEINKGILVYQDELLKQAFKQYHYRESITGALMQELVWITEGFHLGIWYRESKIGPVDDYYVSCLKPKMNGHVYTGTQS